MRRLKRALETYHTECSTNQKHNREKYVTTDIEFISACLVSIFKIESWMEKKEEKTIRIGIL